MEVKGIITIGLEHIHPHPDNPRKDLGDLTELAESIKKNGIMQNLTVIPKEGEPGEYITIIGHRRSAAAKLAGVTEAPCRVVEGMTDKEQMSTMLEENMQRNDLTIWEQAQGFQMMLDLGETEDTIAEKTGFSKKTIRHRLNIAKLDSKTLMEKERQDGYQLSLTDLYELEKIKDVKTRDKILKDSTDSRDLARRAINAQKEQKRQENMKLYVAMMKKLGLKKAPAEADSEFYTDKWERMESYSLDKEPPKTMKFKDNGEPMFYLERYGTLYVIRKAKKAKKVLTPEEEAKKQNMRNKKQIKAILKEAANTRKVFIEGILSGRIKKVTDEKQVEADLFEQISTVSEERIGEWIGEWIGELTESEVQDLDIALAVSLGMKCGPGQLDTDTLEHLNNLQAELDRTKAELREAKSGPDYKLLYDQLIEKMLSR